MISGIDKTIQQLLKQELPIKDGAIDVRFEQPTREWSARLNKPTINFFLYGLQENLTLRRHQWQQELRQSGQGRIANKGVLKRTPFRLDCYYMMSCWASTPEDEHELITRCLSILFQYPLWITQDRQDKRTPKWLAEELHTQLYDIQTQLANPENFANPAELWSGVDNDIKPAVSYVVTLAIDPWQPVKHPFVITRSLDMTVMESGRPAKEYGIRSIVQQNRHSDASSHHISGIVYQKDNDNAPLSNVEVAIRGTGYMNKTDEEGRFQLGNLSTGTYTLMACKMA